MNSPPVVGPIQLRAGQSLRHRLQMPIERQTRDPRHRLVGVLDVQAAAIGRPLRIIDRAVELVADGAGIAPIAIHHIHADILISEQAIIESQVGDLLAVR